MKTRMFAKIGLGLIAFMFLFLVGCSVFDALTGVDPNTGQQDPGGGPLGTVAKVVSGIPGWGYLAGLGVTTIGGGYAAYRGKVIAGQRDMHANRAAAAMDLASKLLGPLSGASSGGIAGLLEKVYSEAKDPDLMKQVIDDVKTIVTGAQQSAAVASSPSATKST